MDKVFWLENGNVDYSQRNVVFLARGETGTKALTIAGRSSPSTGIYMLAAWHVVDSTN